MEQPRKKRKILDNDSTSPFMNLPLDTLKIIFCGLDLLSLSHARVVSKQWNSVNRSIMLSQLNQYFSTIY